MYNEIFNDGVTKLRRMGKKESKVKEAIGMFSIFLAVVVLCALISLSVN